MSSDRRRRHRAALRGHRGDGLGRNRSRPRMEGLEDRVVLSPAPLPGEAFLTGPSDLAPLQIARDYLAAEGARLGMGAADLGRIAITDGYTDTSTGISHFYFGQTLDGLQVDRTSIGVHVTRDGRVITAGGQFSPVVGNLADRDAPTPTVSASQAISRATAALGLTVVGNLQEVSNRPGASQQVTYVVPGASTREVPAFLNYTLDAGGQPRLTWDLEFWVPRSPSTFDVNVDATTGEILRAEDRTLFATYNAFELPIDNPTQGGRSLIVDPQLRAPVASPFGWHDTDGVAGAEFTDTRGNNVLTQDDTDGNDTGGTRPDGGAGLVFDFPFDATQAPSAYLNASITNLFYVVNSVHDIVHNYGFDEVSGNFQGNNYGRGGVGGDVVIADVQDNIGVNNAFWTPAPEGQQPRITMMLNQGLTNPNRDTAMDNEILVHEYGHGISTRLVGGPSNVNSLSGAFHQPGALGEGWSDIIALLLTQKPGDTRSAAEGIGEYAIPVPGNQGGVRTFGYSTDTGVYPRTYSDADDRPLPPFIIHENGTIWASALWQMNWLLIDAQGFEPDLLTPFDLDEPLNNGGNQIALKLIIEGMKLTPANPTYLQARDAILQADLALFGGRYASQIWGGFARYGMGFNASDGGDATKFTVEESFQLPIFIDVAFNASGLAGLFEEVPLNNIILGTLTDRFGLLDIGEYSAMIDWGDGTEPEAARLRRNAQGGLDIIGSHTYGEGGTYTITVTSDRAGSLPLVTSLDLPVSSWPVFAETGLPIVSQEGATLTDIRVGSFIDFDPGQNGTFHYTATIDWGDGIQSSGRLVPRADGGFDVFGTHSYVEGGRLTYRLDVTEAGGQTSSAQGQANIESFPVTATGGFRYILQEGTRFSGQVARFVDLSPLPKDARSYTVVIDWGDGTTSSGRLVPDGLGAFNVLGDHPVRLSDDGRGDLTITVTVTEGGGNTARATSSTLISDAPISAEGLSLSALEGPFRGVVARFIDFNALGFAGEFTARIEWGDGVVTDGTIEPDPNGGYRVVGERPDLPFGTVAVRVTVQSRGGSSSEASSSLAITDAPIVPRGVPVSVPAGLFQGVVASFIDGNPAGSPGEFVASISWGDGTTSAGQVVRVPNGTFQVIGEHAFPVGSFPVGVTITSRGSSSRYDVTSTATIRGAALSARSVPVQGLELANSTYWLGAVFNDNPFGTADDLSVMIDWGDGTTSAGQVVVHPNGPGSGFLIRGEHRFRRSGGFPISATITAPGGTVASLSTAAAIDVVSVPVQGSRGPGSMVNGFAVPGSTVLLFAKADGGDPILVGEIPTSPIDGGWSVSAPQLADGIYTLIATAKNRSGVLNSPMVTLDGGDLVVDHSGPSVRDVFLDPRRRQLLVTLGDSLSGLAIGTLLNPANYAVATASGRSLRIAGVELGQAGADGNQVVIVRLGGGGVLPRGGYTVSVNGAGITDRAGNALTEEIFTPFPQFATGPSTGFVAQIGTDEIGSTPPITVLPDDQLRGAFAFRRFINAGFRRRPSLLS